MSCFNQKIISIKCEFLFALPRQCRLSLPPLFWSFCIWSTSCPMSWIQSLAQNLAALLMVFSFPLLWLFICPPLSYLSPFAVEIVSAYPASFLVITVMKFYSLTSTITTTQIWSFISHHWPIGTLSPHFPLFPSSVLTVLSNLSWRAFFLGFHSTVILVLV